MQRHSLKAGCDVEDYAEDNVEEEMAQKDCIGGLVKMPAEIGPRIFPVPSAGVTGQAGQARNEEKKENTNVYRGRYVEPYRISLDEANTSHKVIYCAATLK